MSQRIRPEATEIRARRLRMHRVPAKWVAAAASLALLFTVQSAAQERPATAKEQMEFGVQMAQRDLWSEALFRFRQAQRLDPDNPRVFNNLAVAHEALGLFEEALDLYRQGLELAPQDKGLRNNYARFVDFYQRFKPDEAKEEDDESAPDEEADPQPPTAEEAAANRRSK